MKVVIIVDDDHHSLLMGALDTASEVWKAAEAEMRKDDGVEILAEAFKAQIADAGELKLLIADAGRLNPEQVAKVEEWTATHEAEANIENESIATTSHVNG